MSMQKKRPNSDNDKRESAQASSREPRYDLAKLVAEIRPENAHPEVDWGESRGEEAW